MSLKAKSWMWEYLDLEKETDTQEPHSVDEVYFVIEGTGHIEIEDKMKPVNRADFIFVPANVHHRFVVGNKDLIMLYFFGCS
jgi:mannose-6-phosphate isomerase-like protein (cupin superfamily)